MKKFLIAAGLGGLVYWFTQKRGTNDEFTFSGRMDAVVAAGLGGGSLVYAKAKSPSAPPK